MAKTIIRETIIILLLCLAIILVLGVFLYSYVPTNKIIPEEVSYAQTEEVKKAIEESVSAENTQVILTYEIDETDLDNYEKVRDYKPGKTNPFSSYQTEEVNEDANNTTTGDSQVTTNTTTNTVENNTIEENSTNNTVEENKTLFPDEGTK